MSSECKEIEIRNKKGQGGYVNGRAIIQQVSKLWQIPATHLFFFKN